MGLINVPYYLTEITEVIVYLAGIGFINYVLINHAVKLWKRKW